MKIAKTSVRATVYDALVDIFNGTQRDVTPTQIMAVTGFNKFMVNDQLELLINEDQTVVRMTRGYFQPVIRFPETRALSRTILPNGMTKIEIGDICLDLTPAEGRKFGGLFGDKDAVRESEAVQQYRILAAQYEVLNLQFNRVIKMLEEKGKPVKKPTAQHAMVAG